MIQGYFLNLSQLRFKPPPLGGQIYHSQLLCYNYLVPTEDRGNECKNNILAETEELIKIFVASFKTPEKKKKESFKIGYRIFENK